eukprot:TRINITY_DN5551_c0_g1_i1.p1 TRINITY_DN5551_c0_g1~~TRINITY_DN5551_c0_g1_i1.p1  ORF type:complete len:359 (-),score=68.08 TRINITY_DN5551_c0_g1_i1:64-1140(-)
MSAKTFSWTVIGAGVSGIAAVGKLLDNNVSPTDICWVDESFNVGDIGAKWGQVPSNTKVDLFLRFLKDCKSFCWETKDAKFDLEAIDPNETCLLHYVIEPLLWVTNHLKEKIETRKTMAVSLNLESGAWKIKTSEDDIILSKNVILAIGSEPNRLSYPGPEVIPLEIGLNPQKIPSHFNSNDVVAVFGSSHSAILVLANLVESKVKSIVNFYRSPHRYAVYLDNFILFDDSGLKGFTQNWARKNIDGELPHNLSRVLVTSNHFDENFAKCNKVVYATGFERRKLPVLEQYDSLDYDEYTGIIAPGLFGVGIGFPQAKVDRFGHLEFRVGLWKFLDYLKKINNIWLLYGKKKKQKVIFF